MELGVKNSIVSILFEKGEVAGIGYTLADTLEGILLLNPAAARELYALLQDYLVG